MNKIHFDPSKYCIKVTNREVEYKPSSIFSKFDDDVKNSKNSFQNCSKNYPINKRQLL